MIQFTYKQKPGRMTRWDERMVSMINTVTLNPAIDKVLFLNELKKNVTNRVQCAQETIGGKGTHVSINLKTLGMTSRAFGICHGSTGLRIIDMLEEHGLDVRFLWRSSEETRTNYLLVEDNGDCTLIAERGVMLSEGDIDDMEDLIIREVQAGDSIVLSGDMSNCVASAYGRIMRRLRNRDVKVFLDTSGPALAECVHQAPFMIKPNVDELSFLCGRPVADDIGDVVSVIDGLDRLHIGIIAVSMGEMGSVLRVGEKIFHAIPPKANVVNTIGCGDCYLAALAYGLTEGLSMEEALKVATGASAATAESPSSVGFDPARAKELTSLTVIRRIR